jgi:hypothetical protein
MRKAILGVFVFGLIVVQMDRGLAQATGTQSELADDALSGALGVSRLLPIHGLGLNPSSLSDWGC